MKKIIVVTGLAGSGKSCYIRKNFEDKEGYQVVSHDFHAEAHYDSPAFKHSKHYEELKETFDTNRIPVIGDLCYCLKMNQNELIKEIHEIDPDIKVEWILMTTLPEQCRKNIDKRDRPAEQKEDEKRSIDTYYPWDIPTNATCIPWTSEDTDCL